nr:PAS domain-containing sensor histidine kinase [uncultured Methanoregula sp.]
MSRFAGLKQNILETAKQHRTKEYYRQISENTREGIIVVQDDVIVYSNRTLKKILGGGSPEEIEGHGFTDMVHPDDRYSIHRLRLERPSGKELELEYPFRVLTRNGEVRCLQCREIVIEWKGQPATLSFLLDITEQKKEEKVLLLTKRKISILNELTRHDIANRLTVLRGRLKRAQRIAQDPQVIRQLEEVDNAGRDIFNHLEMARTYQDMGMFSPRWFNLRSILDYRKILAEVPDLKISIETGNLEIYADPLCPRVFENLIDNSLRHGNHVSEIHITSRQTENSLVVILEDNGKGIQDEDKERIFEHGVGKHTGLGLFLCREILSITGIAIRETGDTGRGARFEITVPRGAYRPNNSRQAIGMPCI